ncbi:hypothetical protein J6590_012415 [Homalodisca vitripennis]|nr:hypothetical protein J6590_012415 [Homalodisca vitripennis]
MQEINKKSSYGINVDHKEVVGAEHVCVVARSMAHCVNNHYINQLQNVSTGKQVTPVNLPDTDSRSRRPKRQLRVCEYGACARRQLNAGGIYDKISLRSH